MTKLIRYLLAFGVAIWSLSEGWAALRAAWQRPDAADIAVALVYAAAFVASFLFLGFWLYAADRAAGRVRRRIRFYEHFIREAK